MLARQRKLVPELKNVKARVAELTTSLGTSAARVYCSKGELACPKAAQSEEAQAANRCVDADLAVRLSAL